MSRICVFLTGCLHLKQHNKYGQKSMPVLLFIYIYKTKYYASAVRGDTSRIYALGGSFIIYNKDISNLTFELVNMCSTTLLAIFNLYPYSQFICRETLNPLGKNHPADTSHWQFDYPHNSI